MNNDKIYRLQSDIKSLRAATDGLLDVEHVIGLPAIEEMLAELDKLVISREDEILSLR